MTEYQEFDILGRVKKSQQWVEGTAYGTPMTYTYNLSGALIEQTYPSGRVVKNSLDSNGDLAQVESKKNAADFFRPYAGSFVYTAAGAVASMRLGNGKFENTVFNSRLQPIQIGLGSSASIQNVLKLNYVYGTIDNNGNVKSQTITVPIAGASQGFVATQNYTYDSLNRIKQATETTPNQTGWQQTFVYDRYGNRRFDTTPNATTTLDPQCPVAVCNPDIDPTNNKLIGYEFDASGNTKTDAENRSFIYDSENKQVEVRDQADAIVGQYSYNGDGLRIKKVVPNGETTIFVYDASSKLVAEYSTIVAPQATAKISYLTNDHLGSPRITTDAFGQVVSRRDFMPFGEEIPRAGYSADSVRQKFTGYERDGETELDFGQARYYSAKVGRFYSVDPENAGASVGNPQTWNAFAYVGNNPINITDPTGLDWYFSDELNEYKWFEDDDEISKGFVRVVGNTGERGSFSYEAEDGTFVTLDPYSNNYQDRIATKEDAIKLADRLYQLDPAKRAFAAGFNKNYDRNMFLLTAMAVGDIVIVAAPVIGLSGAGTTTLGLTGAAAAPTGAALLNQLMTKAEFVKDLTSKTQFVFRGNARQIFDGIAQGATRIGPNAVRMADGKVVSIYESSKAGPLQGPTIQVVENGIKYVYRIRP